MPVYTAARRTTPAWLSPELATGKDLNDMPLDTYIRDTHGIECYAVGINHPTGWVIADTGEPHAPALPATVI